MENKTKAETFIGFVMRAKKFRIGANACATLKKVYLIIVCGTASENTKKEALKLSKRFACPLIEARGKTLDEMTHRENVKVMAIEDRALSKAILDNSEKDFIARD